MSDREKAAKWLCPLLFEAGEVEIKHVLDLDPKDRETLDRYVTDLEGLLAPPEAAEPVGYLTPDDVQRIRSDNPSVPAVNIWATQDEGDTPVYLAPPTPAPTPGEAGKLEAWRLQLKQIEEMTRDVPEYNGDEDEAQERDDLITAIQENLLLLIDGMEAVLSGETGK